MSGPEAKLTFLELAKKVLQQVSRPLTAIEIWEFAVQNGYDKSLNTRGLTPWNTLGAQLYVSVRDDPQSPFARTDTRPKKFYLKSQAGQIDWSQEALQAPSEGSQKPGRDFLEKDLHPFLTYFAFYHLRCYTKSIQHQQSSKREFGEWVHPDVVGCYFPFEDWKQEVQELSTALADLPVRLFSFELKRELNFSNLRESFFQTVSNSSWANMSYLVAAFISEEEEFRQELQRLSAAFGIGVIQLNLADPDAARVIFPARYSDRLDWDTINKLAVMNADVREFITTVKIDISSRKIHKKEYNAIVDAESAIRNFINNKKMK